MPRGAGVFWLAALVVLAAALWLLSGILLPFVAGCAIAYFLDPAVDRLERRRVPRGLAAALVLVAFFLVVATVLLLLLPVLELEGAELARRVPEAIAFGQQQVEAVLATAQERLSPEDLAKLKDLAGGATGSALSGTAQVVQAMLTGGLALANLASLVFITPIVAFFLLRDWDKIIARIDHWLPRRQAETIRTEARQIDATLAGFVHGQVLVGLADAVYYAAALAILGLPFAVILGILTGLLSFVPVVGWVAGFVLALGLGAIQFGPTVKFLAIAVIFAVGYIVEGNFLSPRLVGGRVNLHPVWIIFALLAFGSLFGFMGVLLAVPAAAVIGVLVRFAVARYLASPLYDPER